MAEKMLMTALSPTMEEGTILKWNIQQNDTVASGDLLCEVETDKASMDYESTQDGTVLTIVVPEGATARVGQTIAIVGEKGEDPSALLSEVGAEEGAASAGSATKVATNTATPAPPTNVTLAPPASPGTAPAPSPHTAAPISEPSPEAARSRSVAPSGRVKSSPLARRIARERGIEINTVHGSGPGGRVVASDVTNAAAAPASSRSPALPSAAQLSDSVIPLSGIRSVIAKRLVESKFSSPHFYLSVSIDMAETLAARALLNAKRDPRVSLNAFLIKFVAEAIRRHPEINSSWGGDHIRQFGSVDIGLAVDAGKGLVTPIVRNCLSKGVLAIESDLIDLIARARSNSLKPEDYQGPTFTVSNLGSFGIDEFTAIINPPGAAILAVGRTQKLPVVRDNGSGGDSIVVRSLMKVTLSCDHRVIDGSMAARFLQELKQLMENPARLLY